MTKLIDTDEEWAAEVRQRKLLSKPAGASRTFGTGATRDMDEGKLDFEGFLSPLVLEKYAEYMNANRIQSDGKLRDSDNWQKGIPKNVYMKSMYRHFFDVWKYHRKLRIKMTMEDALCALLFNVMGYLHEYLRKGKETSC